MMPTKSDAAADTPGGEPVEPVEDRANVGTAKPGDYPDRAAKNPVGAAKESQATPPAAGRGGSGHSSR